MTGKIRFAIVPILIIGALMIGRDGRCNELRLETMGGCRIALDDEDNHVNPYDFGRNPAYLLDDLERSLMQAHIGYEYVDGKLKRLYDPERITNLYAETRLLKSLGERHVINMKFHYGRLRQEGVYRSLEVDQYNDPFYLTDMTVGDYEYVGPESKVDYSLRLTRKIYIGAGFDYTIFSGLKDVYTRPEINHNYIKGNLGLIYKPRKSWILGVVASPVRLQNRTEFDKADEGYDNLLYRYYGDGIYDVLAAGSYTVREVLWGVELAAQNFIVTEKFQIGMQGKYSMSENEIKYGVTSRLLRGFWQDTSVDVELLARYRFSRIPLTVGFKGRYLNDDGWAKRPAYDDVLLYDNPVDLVSTGAGITYQIRPLNLLTSLEYVANQYDISVSDHGANLFRSADIVQNVGRLGLEYSLFNLHSIRAGVEVTDCVVDRWLKLPGSIDRYRFTGGFRYRTGVWDVDIHVGYDMDTRENSDTNRNGFSGIIWFTSMID